MMHNSFLKGMGMGLIAGALVTAAVIPIDKRKVMRSGAGKTIKALGHVVEGLSDTFM